MRNPLSGGHNNDGYWQGFTEHRIEALETEVQEVKTDVKLILSKMDHVVDVLNTLSCRTVGSPGCPAPSFVLPGGEMSMQPNPASSPALSLNSLLEGWKGRVTFVVATGVVTAIAMSAFFVVISSNDKFAAIMQVADIVKRREETTASQPAADGKR